MSNRNISPHYDKIKELEIEKKHAIRAARQLCYSKNVISKLEAARSALEITNIMSDARKGKLT